MIMLGAMIADEPLIMRHGTGLRISRVLAVLSLRGMVSASCQRGLCAPSLTHGVWVQAETDLLHQILQRDVGG
jgi:Cu/Ag efflux pump CusA